MVVKADYQEMALVFQGLLTGIEPLSVMTSDNLSVQDYEQHL